MTINEINSYCGEAEPLLSARPNLSKRIRGLCLIGYVEKGIKDVISDTYYITESGLEIKEVQPVDMFPQTSHVETCVLLTLKNQ